MHAFVLISLAGSEENKILEKLKKMDEIIEANVVFGEWDIIAKVEIDDSKHLGQFMIDKIRTLPNIRLTSTLISAK